MALSVYGLSASIRSKHHESRAGRLLYPQSQEQLLAQNKPLVNMAEWMNNIWGKAVFWFFKSPLLSLSSCLSLCLLHIQGVEVNSSVTIPDVRRAPRFVYLWMPF